MSRRLLRVSLGAALLALLLTGCIGFTVSKDVDGKPSDDDGPWVVRVECDNTSPPSDDLVFTGEGTQFTQLDANLLGTVNCTVRETEDGDADEVTVECVDPIPPGVTCTRAGDKKLNVTITGVVPGTDINIPIKVTNEFDPPTTTTTTTTAPAPPPTASGAVAVSPSFTG